MVQEPRQKPQDKGPAVSLTQVMIHGTINRPVQLWFVGVGWLVLTVAFEFSFGLWQGKSWPVLLEAYTFRGGNIWPVVLAVTVLAPYIAAKLKGWV